MCDFEQMLNNLKGGGEHNNKQICIVNWGRNLNIHKKIKVVSLKYQSEEDII